MDKTYKMDVHQSRVIAKLKPNIFDCRSFLSLTRTRLCIGNIESTRTVHLSLRFQIFILKTLSFCSCSSPKFLQRICSQLSQLFEGPFAATRPYKDTTVPNQGVSKCRIAMLHHRWTYTQLGHKLFLQAFYPRIVLWDTASKQWNEVTHSGFEYSLPSTSSTMLCYLGDCK